MRTTIALLMVGWASAASGQARPHFSARELATRPASLPGDARATISLPKPTGPHRIGRIAFAVVDSSRRELMTPDPADLRELILHVWYPTDAKTGAPAPYLDVSLEDSTVRKYYSFALDELPRVRTNTFVGASLSSASRQYPVILFSHGLGMLSSFYSSFIEDLASQGYVVVGVEHSWFAAPFTLPDGRVVYLSSQQADRQRDVVVQAEDLSVVVNVLEWMTRGVGNASPFAGRLDLARLGVFGHSRGGFASPEACRIDRRFKACLNLDGYSMTPAVMDSGITQPFMLIEEIEPWNPPPTDSALLAAGMTRAQADSQRSAASARFENAFAHMRGGAYVVISPGAVHLSFSDLGLIVPKRYPLARQDFRRTVDITRAYIGAFFDTYLRQRPSPLLRGKSSEFPEAWITIYQPGRATQVYPGAPTWAPQ